MKIQFEDKSYIEITKNVGSDKVIVVIHAKDQDNPFKRIVNSVELTQDQFKQLISI